MEKMQDLVAKLNKYAHEYYVLDNPTVSDAEYDALYEELKKLEAELLQVLSESNGEKIDLEQNKTTVKSQLKAYVKKVAKASKLFDEYEKVADEIEKLTQSEAEDAKKEESTFADAVVGLRETETEYADKVEVSKAGVVVKKVKKNKSTVKEF